MFDSVLDMPRVLNMPAICESYPTNDIPNKYIYDAFLMIYLSILLLLFFHFLVLQRR